MSNTALVLTSFAAGSVITVAITAAVYLLASRRSTNTGASTYARVTAVAAFPTTFVLAMAFFAMVADPSAALTGAALSLGISAASLLLIWAVFAFATTFGAGEKMSAAWFGSPTPAHPFADDTQTDTQVV